MAATIEPGLQQELNGRPPWPIAVEIEFSELPPQGQLEKLGLTLEGNIAWGSLQAERIRAIAALPQVRAIRRSSRQTPSQGAKAGARIGFALESALENSSRQEFDVIVTFSKREPEVKMPGLTVHLDMGNGRLNRGQIAELARRDDVQSIELTPEVQLH